MDFQEPWTEDEDFYLSQGYAIFHNSTDIFTKIKEYFPFKEFRTVSELNDRWRFLNDQIESEEQDTIDRIKSASKYHSQTWTYNFEPTFEQQDFNKFFEDYKKMPSLSMQTQFQELQNNKFINENQNINEMCLNYQFDTLNINKIVQQVLNKTIDDITLKATLLNKFKESLSQRGKQYAIEDINRKLQFINEMKEITQIENEVKILNNKKIVMSQIFN